MNNNTNEEETIEEKISRTRFLDYKFNQLETNLKENLKRIEQERKDTDAQLMSMLQNIQKTQEEQNHLITEHHTKIHQIQDRLTTMEQDHKMLSKHEERIINITEKLGTYQTALITIATALIAAVILELIKII